MRTIITIILMAIASPAVANPSQAAQQLGLIEWAADRCGYKPDPAKVEAMLASVMKAHISIVVDGRRIQLEEHAKRHGLETACKAALSALGKN